jgi:hypothetical protein
VLVRLRFSETSPGQVTGYAVGLPGHDGGDGEPFWYGGGRLSAALTLPKLRRRWDPARNSEPERSGRSGAPFRNTPRSTSTRPARPPPRRTTSAAARTVIRPGPPMPPGRRPTPCTSRRGPGAAPGSGPLRPRRPRAVRPDPPRRPRGGPAARSGPADGTDRPDHRRRPAGHGRADREPGGAGRGGRRAAPGPAACRPGRRRAGRGLAAARGVRPGSLPGTAAGPGGGSPAQSAAARGRRCPWRLPRVTATRPSRAGCSWADSPAIRPGTAALMTIFSYFALNRLPWWIAAMRAAITLVTQSFREAGRLSRRRAAIQHILLLYGRPPVNNPPWLRSPA